MEREIRRMLELEQWPDYSIERTRSNHYRVTIFTKDKKEAVIVSSTPSDHRAMANTYGYIRRAIRTLRHPESAELAKKFTSKKKKRKRKSLKPRYIVADQLKVDKLPDNRVFQLPAPAPKREIVARRLNLFRVGRPEAPKQSESPYEIVKSKGYRRGKPYAIKSEEHRKKLAANLVRAREKLRLKREAAKEAMNNPKPRVRVKAIGLRVYRVKAGWIRV